MKLRKSHVPVLLSFALFAACSSDQSGNETVSSGGSPGASGSTSRAGQGSGGSGNPGGSGSNSAGTSASGSSTGGSGASGSNGAGTGGLGASGSSGLGGTSGNSGSGGSSFSGSGGRAGTGGTGGANGGGGNAGRGGSSGNAGNGGRGGSGGAGSGGMSGGGNAGSTSCSFPGSWNPGSATYTTYSLPNSQTACGYEGSNNNIKNIAVAGNYAAIPGNSSSDFNTDNRCGACVQIGNAIVTIVDECPFSGNTPCQNNPTGHLDLSTNAASAGNVKGDPNVHGQNQWKFVPCPINGNVMVRLKNGNNNEFFIENEILPIASVTCGGQTGSRTSYGAWHFANNVNGQSCSATDISNRTITITVGNSQGQNVDSGVQFPKCN